MNNNSFPHSLNVLFNFPVYEYECAHDFMFKISRIQKGRRQSYCDIYCDKTRPIHTHKRQLRSHFQPTAVEKTMNKTLSSQFLML